MTLEERIARALFAHSVPMLTWDEVLESVREEWRIRARAVVAVLPTADVSDAEIEAALSVDLSAFPDFGAINRALVANVRALLDAQAAAHAAEVGDADYWMKAEADARNLYERAAAEVEALRAESSCHRADYILALDRANKAEADRDAYRARIDAVRALCAPHVARALGINDDGSVSVTAGWSLARDVLAALDGDA